jgi:hypothetical protein
MRKIIISAILLGLTFGTLSADVKLLMVGTKSLNSDGYQFGYNLNEPMDIPFVVVVLINTSDVYRQVRVRIVINKQLVIRRVKVQPNSIHSYWVDVLSQAGYNKAIVKIGKGERTQVGYFCAHGR